MMGFLKLWRDAKMYGDKKNLINIFKRHARKT